MGQNPIRQPAERQRLEPNRPRPPEGGQEQAFTSEEHRPQAAGPLDAVIDVPGKCHNAASVHTQGFAVQLLLDNRSTCVQKGESIPAKLLKDEALTTEKARTEALVEGDGHFGSEGRAQEGIFLASDAAAYPRQIHRHDLPRVGCRKRNMALRRPEVREVGHENGLARQHPLADIEQGPKNARGGLGAIPHPRFKLNAVFHPVHGAGFSNHCFLRIKLNFNGLHIISVELVVDFVGIHQARNGGVGIEG